jgi:hypothetical protein
MPFFKADYLFPITQDPIRNGIVHVSPEGEILEIYHEEQSTFY